jgi:hypothetical protein
MIGMSVEPTAYDKIKEYLFKNVLTTVDEINRLLPDSLLFGSLLLYILTHNISFGIFSLFLVESSLLHRLIALGFNKAVGLTPVTKEAKCYTGFRTPRLEVERMLSSNQYPSISTYTLSAISTYLGLSMNSFRDTLDTMGPEWTARFGVAIGFIVTFVTLFLLTRFMRGCETFSEMMTASMFGILVGGLSYVFHSKVFGQESVNFLGLPFLVDKSSKGEPIYVCTSSKVGE